MKTKLSFLAVFCLVNFAHAQDAQSAAAYSHYSPSYEAQKYFGRCDALMDKFYYTNCYDNDAKTPKVLAYTLEKRLLKQEKPHTRPEFEPDWQVDQKARAAADSLKDKRYEMAMVIDNDSMNASKQAQKAIYVSSNLAAFTPASKKIWQKAQKRERESAMGRGSIEVINIVEFAPKKERIYLENGAAVPSAFIKIMHKKSYQECYKIPNSQKLRLGFLGAYRINCSKIAHYDIIDAQ